MTLIRSKTPNVLVVLGVLFTLGGAARLLPGDAGAAEGDPAESELPAAASMVSAESPNSAEKTTPGKPINLTPSTPSNATQVCFTAETAQQLRLEQETLGAERETLQESRLKLAAREAEVQAKFAELDALNAKLDQRWKDMQVTSREDLQHLAQMYGAMKADQAAQIFNQMDPAFAARFLRMISSDQAGLILAGMETDKAYVVSVKLANFNADIRGD